MCLVVFFLFFCCCSNVVVSIFPPPLSSTPPTPTSHLQSFPSLTLSMGPLYMFLDDPFPSFPCYLPLRSLLVTVHLFFISMSLVIFSLLVCMVDQVPLIGEIIPHTGISLSPPGVFHLASCYPDHPRCKGLGLLSFSYLVFHCENVPWFLIHSFTDGHLGCFQYLAIVNCAAMNIGLHRFF